MFRYFGPPGTGKTTTLLNHVEELLSGGTAPNQIGYFAFTRKAAHEARDRAVARFNLDPDKDFVFFRTLHSLAFQLLGISGAEVLKETHLKEFSGIVGGPVETADEASAEKKKVGWLKKMVGATGAVMLGVIIATHWCCINGHAHAQNEPLMMFICSSTSGV